jgi:hypothetical protein
MDEKVCASRRHQILLKPCRVIAREGGGEDVAGLGSSAGNSTGWLARSFSFHGSAKNSQRKFPNIEPSLISLHPRTLLSFLFSFKSRYPKYPYSCFRPSSFSNHAFSHGYRFINPCREGVDICQSPWCR